MIVCTAKVEIIRIGAAWWHLGKWNTGPRARCVECGWVESLIERSDDAWAYSTETGVGGQDFRRRFRTDIEMQQMHDASETVPFWVRKSPQTRTNLPKHLRPDQ